MKDKPIIFNTSMVRAIMRGNKTQTRRLIKPQPTVYIDRITGHGKYYSSTKKWGFFKPHFIEELCPYKIGQTLWVKETFNDTWCDHVIYKADGGSAIEAGYSREPRWKPSIHMPRKAARIFLEVEDIRVEKLQDISLSDILKEGIQAPSYTSDTSEENIEVTKNLVNSWIELWNSINEERYYGWVANPWVWVIDFKRIRGE